MSVLYLTNVTWFHSCRTLHVRTGRKGGTPVHEEGYVSSTVKGSQTVEVTDNNIREMLLKQVSLIKQGMDYYKFGPFCSYTYQYHTKSLLQSLLP